VPWWHNDRPASCHVLTACPCPGCIPLSMPMSMIHAYLHAACPCPCLSCMSCPCCMFLPMLMLRVQRLQHSGLLNLQRLQGGCKQSPPLYCLLPDRQDHGDDAQPFEGHRGKGLQEFRWPNKAVVEVGNYFFSWMISYLPVCYHCGGRPTEVNACVLNSYMVYL
jgi:hypothetical protein